MILLQHQPSCRLKLCIKGGVESNPGYSTLVKVDRQPATQCAAAALRHQPAIEQHAFAGSKGDRPARAANQRACPPTVYSGNIQHGLRTADIDQRTGLGDQITLGGVDLHAAASVDHAAPQALGIRLQPRIAACQQAAVGAKPDGTLRQILIINRGVRLIQRNAAAQRLQSTIHIDRLARCQADGTARIHTQRCTAAYRHIAELPAQRHELQTTGTAQNVRQYLASPRRMGNGTGAGAATGLAYHQRLRQRPDLRPSGDCHFIAPRDGIAGKTAPAEERLVEMQLACLALCNTAYADIRGHDIQRAPLADCLPVGKAIALEGSAQNQPRLAPLSGRITELAARQSDLARVAKLELAGRLLPSTAGNINLAIRCQRQISRRLEADSAAVENYGIDAIARARRRQIAGPRACGRNACTRTQPQGESGWIVRACIGHGFKADRAARCREPALDVDAAPGDGKIATRAGNDADIPRQGDIA